MTHYESLVNKVSNGGVDGEYITVTNTSPYRNVKSQGINNHKIKYAPIATVGALDHSKVFPVIISMH